MSKVHLLKLDFHDSSFSNIKKIRKEVFTTEMGISELELFDDYDKTCDHYIIFDGKQAVGSVRCVKINDHVKLERMAILPYFRKKNYGKESIIQLTELYRCLGFSKIILDSVFSVRNFYKKCGFVEEGDIFLRVGLDHIRMSLSLSTHS